MILKFIQPMYDSSLLVMIILSVLHHQELQEVQLWKKIVCSNVWDLNLCLQRTKEYINHVYPLWSRSWWSRLSDLIFCFLAPGCTRSATSYTLEIIHELCMHVQALLSLNAWLKIRFGLERGVMHFQLLLSREWRWWWWSLDIVFRMPQKRRGHTF